jgi:hypothetical protein
VDDAVVRQLSPAEVAELDLPLRAQVARFGFRPIGLPFFYEDESIKPIGLSILLHRTSADG